MYTVTQKRPPFISWITLSKIKPILMILARKILRKFKMKILQIIHLTCQM